LAAALLVLASGTLPSAVAAEPAAGAELTLAEAVAVALQQHPALRAADRATDAAASGIEQARAGFLPSIELSESVLRGNNPVYAFGSLLNQGRFTAADFALDRLNHPDPITNWRTNLGGSVPLFMGGRTRLGFEQAQLAHQAVRTGRTRVEQEVIFGVSRAYAAILLAEEALATVDSAVRTAEANLTAAEARQEAGMVVASDALAARVRLARLQEERIAAGHQVSLSQATLNEAMGIPLGRSHRLTGSLALPPAGPEQPEELERLAREHRPDLKQVELEEQRLAKEIQRAKGTFLPSLHLMGNYEINNHGIAADGQDSWSVGLALNWNLFKGGGDRARLAEAQAHYYRTGALKERLANAIGLEVREASLALATARERADVARQAILHAEEALRIVRERYQAGLTTIVELLDSETALTAARTTLTRTLYDATVGQARLELSLGLPNGTRK
jgi:outer membrane protein TolC